MNEYVIAIVAGLVVAVIAAAAIWIFYMKYKKDREMWKQIAEDSYNRGKDEASEIVRSTCDQIEEDKAKLAELSDRKLLIDIMLALGSYGRRLDRIDAKLKCITNYKAYIRLSALVSKTQDIGKRPKYWTPKDVYWHQKEGVGYVQKESSELQPVYRTFFH